jgi:2-polyprenyl-3-methyl-5-hydroxy-6-metoxy-1,4-benzoquinol methylase
MESTNSAAYTRRLARVQGAAWKRYAPNPYRTWLRRLDLGFTLDVGCGLGRSLGYLDGNGVGVDHNAEFVAECRNRGLIAFTPEEFQVSRYGRPGLFDALICMHVLEHLEPGQAEELLATYLPAVRPGGRVVLATPQERGWDSDPTHTMHVDGDDLVELATGLGLTSPGWSSFPLPRWAGKLFIYNEFQLVATVPEAIAS